MSKNNPSHDLPLSGIKVIEIGSSVAAPYATWVLAGLGADILKVENAGSGDDTRQWGKIFTDGSSSTFHSLNAGKRSITINLKSQSERTWLRELCLRDADVVIQNLRPGLIETYGLGSAELVHGNPKLIYCNLRAFGAKGPLKDKAGYDPLMQAYGGLMSVTGEDGRPPVRVGTSIIDMGTGLWCVTGILSALFQRQKTGRGCIVDTSLYETALAWMTTHVTAVQVDGENSTRQGSGVRGMAPYQAYACKDGYLVIAAPNDKLFDRLAEVLGYPGWPDDPRFNSNQQRSNNMADLNALIEPLIAAHSRAYWQGKLDIAGVPSAPVQNTLEMMADAQTEALGIIQEVDGGGPRLMGMPLSFDGVRPKIGSLAPRLGEHDHEVKGKDWSKDRERNEN